MCISVGDGKGKYDRTFEFFTRIEIKEEVSGLAIETPT